VGGLTADGYQLENNILPQVEEGDPGGDRADWYKLQEKLVETEGTYRLRIAEFENEHSRLDEIRLMSVDHPQGTRLFVSDGGQMDLVVPSPDDLEIQAPRKGGTADAAVWRIEAKESFTMLRKAAAGASAKSDPMNVVIGKGIGRFKPRINYRSERAPAQPLVARFRERPTEVLLPLELARGEAVALEAQQPFALLGAELALRVGIRPESSDLRMLSAFGPDGACTEQVAALDGSVAELSPGQSIDLEFEATPVPIGMERSFVVMSSGRYEKIEEAAAPAPPAPRPQLRFSAGASAASGDALRLEYETATGGQVRIALYDLQGREIEVSEEGDREAGVHRSAWTPRPLPPAIYFARLSVRAPDGGQFVSDPIRIVRTR
jgi:hypothetical protein